MAFRRSNRMAAAHRLVLAGEPIPVGAAFRDEDCVAIVDPDLIANASALAPARHLFHANLLVESMTGTNARIND